MGLGRVFPGAIFDLKKSLADVDWTISRVEVRGHVAQVFPALAVFMLVVTRPKTVRAEREGKSRRASRVGGLKPPLTLEREFSTWWKGQNRVKGERAILEWVDQSPANAQEGNFRLGKFPCGGRIMATSHLFDQEERE